MKWVARPDVISRVAARVGEAGCVLEFGVAYGTSTRQWRSELTNPVIGFDSFEGLPEAWANCAVGEFACDPPEIEGVQLVVGYFADSLTPELAEEIAEQHGHVALASFDADLYSSTLEALTWLTPLLQPGSLLLFDEYLGGGATEKRAHLDWMEQVGVVCEPVDSWPRVPAGFGVGDHERALFESWPRLPPGFGVDDDDERALFEVRECGPIT